MKVLQRFEFEKPIENNPYHDRPCPTWFNDAKVGIFIHWGPYSVPGWAPTGKPFLELIFDALLKDGNDFSSVNALAPLTVKYLKKLVFKGKFGELKKLIKTAKNNTYSEWYWNSLLSQKSTQKHHKKHWGNKKYADFSEDFNEAVENWDPNEWAVLFKEAGAKYVLTTSKHHDGFCLWPTAIKNPKIPNWNAKRDLMGELKTALDNVELKTALYYSAGLDWSLSGVPVGPTNLYKKVIHDKKGLEYMDAQVMELIDKYKPDLLWEDIMYSKNGDFNKILDHYYSNVPEGVVNDRAQSGFSGTATRHFDYTTTEYSVPKTIYEIPWEICRGISGSFGYNREDDKSTTLTVEELVASLADIVSKNGNLMLGLGPKADGTIPEHQITVLKEFGQWLKVNGEAIYGSRPYTIFEDTLTQGNAVRYTTKGAKLNAIIVGSVQGVVEFKKLKIKKGAEVKLLGSGSVKRNSSGALIIENKTVSSGCVLTFNIQDVKF